MPFLVRLVRCALFLVLGLGASGCLPSSHGQLEEEKDPHFLAGKSRVNALDYEGALECFEKALESNPHSALAHFEAGLLYEKQKQDHAAAIYHFQRYLQLRPSSGYAEVVRQHILACKQELVKTVSLGPITQGLQREFDQINQENKRLREEVERWRAFAGRLQTATNPTPQFLSVSQMTSSLNSKSIPPQATPSLATNAENPSRPSTTAANSHVVKTGETPSVIARRYGVKTDALMAANPRLDPRRLRVGQLLNIPTH
jgi:tetratricopeptide (TPR) repeat protein